MPKTDVSGRAYATVAEIKSGDYLEADGDFTCIKAGAKLLVQQGALGLYVTCSDGKHYLDGQNNADGVYLGLYPVREMSAAFRSPDFITFTGVDDATSLVDLFALSSVYPIEWGVLLSPKRSGNDPRYPGHEKALKFLNSSMVTAAHVCGGYAKAVMNREPIPHLGMARRVQINHVDPDLEAVVDYSRGTGFRVILQARDELAFPTDLRVEWLFDQSGGKGERPQGWPPYPEYQPQRRVGYAGGIGPDNVRQILTQIGATGPYWIDMESSVRDENDQFDIAKVRAVCEAVYGVR